MNKSYKLPNLMEVDYNTGVIAYDAVTVTKYFTGSTALVLRSIGRKGYEDLVLSTDLDIEDENLVAIDINNRFIKNLLDNAKLNFVLNGPVGSITSRSINYPVYKLRTNLETFKIEVLEDEEDDEY